MKVQDIINRLNSGEKAKDLVEEFKVSRDTIRRRLDSIGYRFDNSAKQYFYHGSEPQATIDEMDFLELIGNVKLRGVNAIKNKFRPIHPAINSNRTSNSNSDYDSNVDSNVNNNLLAINEIATASLDELDEILSFKTPSEKKKSFHGFYLEEDIEKVLEGISKGKRSEFVNRCLRRVFKDKGLL